ncbi:MAG TPA: S9 family peptidase [Steroidobacteraceae bacterium]|nr:S9 family peptidase [Steroidobacteraceae bacterium]
MDSHVFSRVRVRTRFCLALLAAAAMTGANSHVQAGPVVSPYGSWNSPLRAEVLSSGRVAMGDLRSADGRLYWTESMPAAGGISGLFSAAAGESGTRISPEGINVRTRVHEYGGAPFVASGGHVYYSNYSDQRLYALGPDGKASALTPDGYRYADCVTVSNATALICVREDHTDAKDVRNAVVRIPLPAGGPGEVLYSGSDFVAFPRPSPDGKRLAFVAWNHPNMPWDGTELKVAELGKDGLQKVTTVAGGTAESVLEPQWGADGTLYFISDRSGYWNLYANKGTDSRLVWKREAEFASPLWTLGQANYVLLGDGHAVAGFSERGSDKLAVIDLQHGTARILDLPYVEFSHLTRLDSRHIAALVGSVDAPPAIMRIDIANGSATTVRSAGSSLLPKESISIAKSIEFPVANGQVAYALYYPPRNAGFVAPTGALPPLLTFVHGGPTSQATAAFAARIQFWTSRGFAVVDVNHRGSSGFGRDFRRQLNGNWGIVDVEDAIAAVRYLGKTGAADPARTAISGGSAGGYTVLNALSTSDVFKAGADYYGISDMTALAQDTHKFESRYLDSLIGPYPAAKSVYQSRSPLNHLDGFKVPLIVLQGADDPVVPPNQSEKIVDALRKRHVPVAYLLFPGESHGFRKPDNTTRALQAELSFYGQVFGFEPADSLPPLKIEGLANAS